MCIRDSFSSFCDFKNDFYNNVIELSTEDKKQISEIPFSEEEYRTEVGVSELAGEEGFSTLERIWSRPTIDLNGIWGGFQGEGIKTVLPSKACAKISCRLVANQDPSEIFECVNRHVKKNLPHGVSFQLKKLFCINHCSTNHFYKPVGLGRDPCPALFIN